MGDCQDPSSPIASSLVVGTILLILGDAFGFIAWREVFTTTGQVGAAILGALLAAIGVACLLVGALKWPAHKARWHR